MDFWLLTVGDWILAFGSVILGSGERLSVLSQDHFAFDEYTVLDTVLIVSHDRHF